LELGRLHAALYFPRAILGRSRSWNEREAGWRVVDGAQKRTKEKYMKRLMIIATAALLSSGAFAQTATVELAPEQRTKIKQYVTTQKVAPVTFKEKVTVGATLPADVRLSPVPADWGPSVSKYQYVYSDNHVYFVEPSTRKVVTVID
jgi:hypothetical protein